MAERHPVSTDLFWTLAVWIGALLGGVAFAVVIGRIAGAGVGAGLFFGTIIFVVTGLFVAGFAGASSLPPPNTLTAPTVPRSATSGPRSGASDDTMAPALPETVGGKVAKASFHTGEAVRALGAAVGQAATELGGVVGKVATEVSGTVARKAVDVRDEVLPAKQAPVEVQPDEARVAPDVAGSQPPGLAAAREGGADDLKKIKGVGPKLEGMLNGLGYYHFDQIAAWSAAEIAWVDSHLEGFNGRATRDDWVGQAKVLSGGGETEFSTRVDRGEIY
jgi:predicted flap endonuclease-1-like 5' DNA nuclease